MNLRFFIDRPVFSGVISVVIVLMGVIAMKALPVEQYPDIAPPTINVWAGVCQFIETGSREFRLVGCLHLIEREK